MHTPSLGTGLNVAPTFWLMGTGRSSSSLADEAELSTGFILSAGFVGAAVLPREVLACFGTAGFGAVFPWDSGSVFAGAAVLLCEPCVVTG